MNEERRGLGGSGWVRERRGVVGEGEAGRGMVGGERSGCVGRAGGDKWLGG